MQTQLNVLAHSSFQVITGSLVGTLIDGLFPMVEGDSGPVLMVELMAQSSFSSLLAYGLTTGESFAADPLAGFVFAFFLFGTQRSLLKRATMFAEEVWSIVSGLRLDSSRDS